MKARANRTVLLLVVSLAVLPLVADHLGRLPQVSAVLGVVIYAVYRAFCRISSTNRAQALTALLVVAFYVGSALTSVKPESLVSVDLTDPTGYYAALAESMLRGKLSLLAEPATALLRAKNPYVPGRNYAFLWDASYYKENYYLYFGPVPALVLYLPFRVVTQRSLPAPFALAAFLTAGYVGSLCVLERARKVSGLRRQPALIQVLSTLLLGLATLAPLVLRRPSVYEVAIASAYCFLMWGSYALLGAVRTTPTPYSFAQPILASLLMGLSAGSRATLLGTGLFLLVGLLAQSGKHWRAERWKVWQRGVPLLVPFACCVLLLGLYNRLRFDAWGEFGMRYQLNHLDMLNMKTSVEKVVRGVGYYLFAAPSPDYRFPAIRIAQTTRPFGLPHHPTLHEGVLGLFPAFPVTLILGVAPLLALRETRVRFRWIAASLVGYSLLMLLAVSAAGVSGRYEMDFVPGLLIASILTFYALRTDRLSAVGVIAELFWVPAALYTIALGVLVSISDQATPDSLKTHYPAVYTLLRQLLWQ